MDDMISRQAALDELKTMYRAAEKWEAEAKDDVIKARAESCMATIVEIKLRVEKLPSAHPSADWIECTVSYDAVIEEWQSAKCSACGRYHTTPYMYWFDNYNYCPHCGARMRGNHNEK